MSSNENKPQLTITTDGTSSGMSLSIDDQEIVGFKKINFKPVARSDDLKIEISMASIRLKGGTPRFKTEILNFPEDVDRILAISSMWEDYVEEEEEEETDEELEAEVENLNLNSNEEEVEEVEEEVEVV